MMNIRLSVCQHLARLALLVSLALLVAMSLLNKPALAQDPDFSAIDDPLDGQYELFAVDDLLIQRPKGQNSSTETQINNYVLETNNETISSQTKLGMVRHCY